MRRVTGQILDQRYHIMRRIGEGAYGLVYEARDLQSGFRVAVKLLREMHSDPEYCVRLVREAKAMAALRGTSAVQIHNYGADVDGSFYIVMEYLEGETFEERLEKIEAAKGKLAVRELLGVMKPIIDTLEAAHDRGIVHRDLKPSNIFLVSSGGVRLLDFGLAKVIGAKPLTREGMIAGSPSYIAPEGWRGDPRALDHRIDIYSLGVIVFRALAGQVPFEAEDLMQKLVLVTRGDRPSLRAFRPDLPPLIDDWVAQVLAIKPEHRFERVRSAWNALVFALEPIA